MVWQAGLLHQKGIKGHLWRLINNWYRTASSTVLWAQQTSRHFNIMQGIRHGGVLSPFLYCLFVNQLSCLHLGLESRCHSASLTTLLGVQDIQTLVQQRQLNLIASVANLDPDALLTFLEECNDCYASQCAFKPHHPAPH